MDRPRLIRGMRIAWTGVFGILSVLLIVLWVRSYAATDIMQLRTSMGRIGAFSANGSMAMWIAANQKTERTVWDVSPHDDIDGIESYSELTLRAFPVRAGLGLQAPHWLLLLCGGMSGVIIWRRLSFSLRTLLIATTLIALLLGTAVYLRLW